MLQKLSEKRPIPYLYKGCFVKRIFLQWFEVAMTTRSVDCKTLRISEPQTGKSNASCKLERMVAPPGSRVLEEKVESL